MAMLPCKDIHEFVSKYDNDLEKILCSKHFRKWFDPDDLQEVKTTVYLHLMEHNFFEKYDPTKASLSTHLFNHLKWILKSKKSGQKKFEENILVILDAPVMDHGYDNKQTLLDICDFAPPEDDTEKEIQQLFDGWSEIEPLFIACLKKKPYKHTRRSVLVSISKSSFVQIKSTFKPWKYAHPKDTLLNAYDIYKLFKSGKSNVEVAEILHLSRQTTALVKSRVIKQAQECLRKVRKRSAFLSIITS